MPLYDYKIAKTVLSDKDKERFLCLFLSTRSDGTVNWDKATADFNCASVDSMKTMFYSTLRKVEKAGGKLASGTSNTPTTSATPASSTPRKARASKKRKASPVDEDEDDEEATPVIKKQSRKTGVTGAVSKGATEVASGIKSEPASEAEDGTTT